MKTLFAITVSALLLVGCGPLDESETVTGQVAQAVVTPQEPGPILNTNPVTPAQQALVGLERPRTFENTYLYRTGLEHTVGTVPGSTPH